jgi:hypothetical protein
MRIVVNPTDVQMSESVACLPPMRWLHEAVLEDGALTFLRRALPSEALDTSVSWTQSPRRWDAAPGAVVRDVRAVGGPYCVVTAEGRLQPVSYEEAVTLLDPVGGPELNRRHAYERACGWARLGPEVFRHERARLPDCEHRFALGFQRWPSWHDDKYGPVFAVVTRVSDRQVWARAASWEEAKAQGAVT